MLPQRPKHPLQQRFPNVTFGNAVQIIGLANTRIGYGSAIGDGVWLNVCNRDDSIRLTIGRNVLIGRHSCISSGGNLEIADYCLLGPQVYVSDADHVVTDITRPYAEQGATAGRVVVEENCWLGIRSVVTGDITVGRGSVIAANAVATRDVPPFTIVAGVPARIIKMFDPRTNAWRTATTPEEQQEIMLARERTPLPGREEYQSMLSRTTRRTKVNPLLTGRGECI